MKAPKDAMQDQADSTRNGLEQFADRLHPGVLADIDHWAGDPRLSKLHAALHAHSDETAFFDSYAEALVARYLQRHGCTLEFEVETPAGKACDFRVQRGDQQIYLHVKRVHSERIEPRQLTISPRLRYLERIKRPYVVRVRWHEGLSDAQMQQFVSRAADFISHARLGDELTIRDESGETNNGNGGTELGGVRIVAPWAGSHVSLAIDLPAGFTDETDRIHKLLTRAYKQFMPRALNAIIICSMNKHEVTDFQNALLGTLIERWDVKPPPGKRIAHGRAPDGFWNAGRFEESVVASWFAFSPADSDVHLRFWQRKGAVLDVGLQEMVADVLGGSE